MDKASTITLQLADADELFVGPVPGVRHIISPGSIDDVGAMLGQSGVDRLLQMDSRHAARLVIVTRQPPPEPDDMLDRLRAWCECQLKANERTVCTTRRLGRRGLLFALSALAVALAVSWIIQNEVLFGPAGAMRNLLGEALVIAGWVAMWRPVEMLLFDTIAPMRQNRHLKRLLSMPWNLESGRPTSRAREGRPFDAPDRG